MTDNQETFTVEFEKLSKNLESIYQRLSDAIRDLMDSQVVSDNDKERYQDMVEQMAKAVMNPVNKKVAFLTFKIVEETIKRVCLKNDIEKLMPVVPECIQSMRKSLNLPTNAPLNNEKVTKNSFVSNIKHEMTSKAGSFMINQQTWRENEMAATSKVQDDESQSQFDYNARQSRQSRFRGSEARTVPADEGRNPEMLEQPTASIAINSNATKMEVGNTAT